MLRILNITGKDSHPKKRGAYGVSNGKYTGEMLTYVETKGELHRFLSMPKMVIREIPKESFEFGMTHNIIEFVEQLPRNVFQVVAEQFKISKTDAKDNPN